MKLIPDGSSGELFVFDRLEIGSVWGAKLECVGGTMLVNLPPADKSLAKVRFSYEVFEILRQKKRKGESIQAAIERIIIEAPFPKTSQEKRK